MSKLLDEYTGSDSEAFAEGIHREANGYWKPIYPSELGRALKHVEADYNYKVLTGTLANYRIYPSTVPVGATGAQVEDFTGDSGNFLQLNYDVTEGWYWTLAAAGGGGSLWTQNVNDIYYNTGRVGIGTSTPSNKLHVQGSAKITSDILLDGKVQFPPVDNTQPIVTGFNDTNTLHTAIYMDMDGDDSYLEYGHVSSTYTYTQIRIVDNNVGDRFRVYVDDHQGQSYDRIPLEVRGDRVLLSQDGGNVGIGTDNPQTNLHIIAPEGQDAILRIETDLNNTGGETDNPKIEFVQDGGNIESAIGHDLITSGNIDPNSLQIANSVGTGGGIAFATDNNNSGYANADVRMFISSAGNVGIGTTGPGEALEVIGKVEASDEFIGDLRGAVRFNAQAGEALSKCDTVYISGISGNTPIVMKADASDPNKMPAFGCTFDSAALNTSVEIVTFGTLQGHDTQTPGWSLGDTLYVSATTPGLLTNVKPSGESNLIQNIAKVQRVDLNGSIKIGGAGRSNDTPNLNRGGLFVGDSNNYASALPVGTSGQVLTVDGSSDLIWQTPAGSLWTQNGNDINYSTGNVGIDVASPTALLHVGTPTGTPAIKVGRGSGQPNIKSSDIYLIMDSNSGYLSLNHFVSDDVALARGGGNVGIGLSNPSFKFHVLNGTADLDSKFESNAGHARLIIDSTSADDAILQFNEANARKWSIYVDGTDDNLKITRSDVPAGATTDAISIDTTDNVSIPNGTLTINDYTFPAADGNPSDVLQTDGAGNLSFVAAGGGSPWTTSGSDIYYNTGKVGVGLTTGFAATLHVKGQGSTSGTTSFLVQDSNGESLIRLNDDGQGIAIGHGAAGANSANVGGNIVIGKDAMNANGTGFDNVYIGTSAGFVGNAGWRNVALGASALRGKTGNYTFYSTAIGYYSMYDSTSSGAYTGANTALGAIAGKAVTSGVNNVFIGTAAGYNLTTGSNNIFIGSATGGINSSVIPTGYVAASSASVSNELNIGDQIVGSMDATDQYTTFNGQVYTPTSTLTSATSITPDFTNGNVYTVDLAHTATLNNPSNMKDGATYIIIVKQTGSFTLSYGTAYKFESGSTPTITTGSGAVDILTFVSDGTDMYGVAAQNFS